MSFAPHFSNVAMNGSIIAMDPPEARLNGTVNGRIRPGDKRDLVGKSFIELYRTHDISSASFHVPDIQTVGTDIHNAVQAVWPKRHEIRYSTAHVLLLSWADDDLGVEKEIKDLRDCFERRYRFEVAEYQIPSEKPIFKVHQRIGNLLGEFDEKETLLIVYYAGHARLGMQSNEGSIWFPNRKDPSIAVPSGGVQSLLEEADADVLLLYDCCHSASAPTCHPQLAKGGRTESIAACGFDDVAAEVDDHSFTKALTHILVLASTQTPFTVGELHARVMSQLKCYSAPLARDQEGNHTDHLEAQRRKTPIYSILSETKPCRSIVLGPLPLPAAQLSFDEQHSPISSPVSPMQAVSFTSTFDTQSKKRKMRSEVGDNAPHVLVTARVDKTDLNIQEWKNWIAAMPEDGKGVTVEGRWLSFSTLLLLRMPVAVWNLLPESSAYDFVGFVTSENQVPLQNSEIDQAASLERAEDEITVDTPQNSPHQTDLRGDCSLDQRYLREGNANLKSDRKGKGTDFRYHLEGLDISAASLDLLQDESSSSQATRHDYWEGHGHVSQAAEWLDIINEPQALVLNSPGLTIMGARGQDAQLIDDLPSPAEEARPGNSSTAGDLVDISVPPTSPLLPPLPMERNLLTSESRTRWEESSHEHRSNKAAEHSQKVKYYYVWSCDSCWNAAGMTTHNTTHCSECNHQRCKTCPTEAKEFESHR